LNPKGILINIFGGITRCDIVAEAIVLALTEFPNSPPMAIRLAGTNEQQGLQILENNGILAFHEVTDAIQKLKEMIS
jgi:succinyl-CoA synthetase beta subunit